MYGLFISFLDKKRPHRGLLMLNEEFSNKVCENHDADNNPKYS
jgi:hypothetical protein